VKLTSVLRQAAGLPQFCLSLMGVNPNMAKATHSLEQVNSVVARTSDVVEKITAVPLMIIGASMVLVVLVGTFWRYVLNDPILWTEEAARYLMIWMALGGASISIKRREHVGIRLIVQRLPIWLQKLIQLISSALIAYFLYVLIREGWILAWGARFQVSPALGFAMFWPLLSVPVSGVLMLVQLVLVLVIDFTDPNPAQEGSAS
jgi:TRAP-type C4-dicarboxylate transport system permease small subunit